MADTYDVNGVSVSPAAGGYYDLTHPSLPDGTERVQGKDKADERAAQIAKDHAAAGGGSQSGTQGGTENEDADDGKMTKQADMTNGTPGEIPNAPPPTTDGKIAGDPRTPAQKGVEREAESKGLMDETKLPGAAADPKASSDPKARGEHSDELDELRSQLAAANERVSRMTDAARDAVAGVVANEPPQPAVPITISRRFNGQMSDDDKSALKKAGIETKTIVLEESDSIPPTGLFIGHNGRSYVIKPGEEVEVPSFLTDVLDDAVMSAPVVDGSTQKILGYRNRSRYPYRVVNPKG